MAEQQLSFLVPEAAKSARAELLAALGTEANAAQWMTFMQTVTRLLPDVLSVGRPTAEAIKRSAIGQLGFASWQAMIEAPTSAGGLGWNFSAWKAWRRAWAVVQAQPWLMSEPVTSSEINTLSADVKRAGVPFPGSSEELKAFRSATRDAAERRKAETTQAQRERADTAEALVAQLRTQLAAATARAAALAEQQTISETRAQELAKQVGQQAQKIEQLQKDLAEARKPQPQPKPKPQPALTRWQHLMAAIKGKP